MRTILSTLSITMLLLILKISVWSSLAWWIIAMPILLLTFFILYLFWVLVTLLIVRRFNESIKEKTKND